MRLAHVFFNVHMGASHGGIKKIIATEGLKMAKGDVAMFVNHAWNRLKMYIPEHDLILYLNRPAGIVPGALKLLPLYVEGKALQYDKALAEAIKRGYVEHAREIGKKVSAKEVALQL